MVPKRIASAIMNSLKGGVVPRVGLGYIAVGREKEIDALLHDIEIVQNGGASFRFIVGRYGSGKSFLLQTIRNYAMDRGFVVVDADLSPERRFTGSQKQGLATYRELMKNKSTKTTPDGGALPLILEKWIYAIQQEVMREKELSAFDEKLSFEVELKIFETVGELKQLVHGFDFAKALSIYWHAYRDGNEENKSNVLRWFRGEYSTKTEAKRDLGLSEIITDSNWYDYLKLFASFLVKAGFKGLLMLVDELVNIYKIPNSQTRQYNYDKLLSMYNDTLQGKASHMGIIMALTPQALEDPRKGIYSYEALRTRLESGWISASNDGDMMAPVIKLAPLEAEEIFVLLEKLASIHADLYGYESKITQKDIYAFWEIESGRIGAQIYMTPREIIRDFIELLNVLYQNPDKTVEEVLGSSGFEFAVSEDDDVSDEFAEFTL
ncbi:MAG: ATP-binding protein [Clostridiaceae bacterium]|nr:ATP-binding protein [Clostridiaceae bacterium]